MATFNEALKEAVILADKKTVYADCLSVVAPSMAANDEINVYNAVDEVELVAGGITYLPFGFGVKDHDIESGTQNEAVIQVPFFDKQQLKALRIAAKDSPPPSVTYRCYDVTDFNSPVLYASWLIPMSMDSIRVGKGTFEITVLAEDFINPDYFKEFINVQRFPGLRR